jgi:hypothetical protein
MTFIFCNEVFSFASTSFSSFSQSPPPLPTPHIHTDYLSFQAPHWFYWFESFCLPWTCQLIILCTGLLTDLVNFAAPFSQCPLIVDLRVLSLFIARLCSLSYCCSKCFFQSSTSNSGRTNKVFASSFKLCLSWKWGIRIILSTLVILIALVITRIMLFGRIHFYESAWVYCKRLTCFQLRTIFPRSNDFPYR